MHPSIIIHVSIIPVPLHIGKHQTPVSISGHEIPINSITASSEDLSELPSLPASCDWTKVSLAVIIFSNYSKNFFVVCTLNSHKNGMYRTFLLVCYLLICQIVEIIHNKPSSLYFRQCCNRIIEPLIADSTIDNVLHRFRLRCRSFIKWRFR